MLSEESNNKELNLHSISEFSSRLESENVDISNSDAYEVCVLLEFEDTTVNDEVDLDAKNISVDNNDIDASLVFYHIDNVPTDQ